MLTIGYLWEENEKFWFFIMCHDWLNVSGHSLLKHILDRKAERKDEVVISGKVLLFKDIKIT